MIVDLTFIYLYIVSGLYTFPFYNVVRSLVQFWWLQLVQWVNLEWQLTTNVGLISYHGEYFSFVFVVQPPQSATPCLSLSVVEKGCALLSSLYL